MHVIFYLFLMSVITVYGSSYRSVESAWIDRAQLRIPRLNNLPMQIQMGGARQRESDCRCIGERIVSGLAFLFCCSTKKNDESRDLHHEDELPLQAFVSNDVQRNLFDAAQRLRNKGLYDLLVSRTTDVEAIERAVLAGADPWGEISDKPDELLSPLVIYAAKSLDGGGVCVRDWSYKIYAVLNAHRLREEQSMQSESFEQRCDKFFEMRHAVRVLIGEFGKRQDVQAFEQNGPLWGEICRLLGANMPSMRMGVFSLLKKDISGTSDYIIHKTLQTQFGSFERFALACAVNDFVYCLASTIATNNVYDIHSFCNEGILVKVNSRSAPACKVYAECVRASLNNEANARLSCMVSLLTMRAGM